MIEEISKTDEILKRLKKIPIDPQEYLESIIEMNKAMENVRQDYLTKNARSIKSARETYLTNYSLS